MATQAIVRDSVAACNKGCGALVGFQFSTRSSRWFPIRVDAQGKPMASVLHHCGQSEADALAESAQFKLKAAQDRLAAQVAKLASVQPQPPAPAAPAPGTLTTKTGRRQSVTPAPGSPAEPVKIKLTDPPASAAPAPGPQVMPAAQIKALADAGFSLTDIMAEIAKLSR